MQPLYYPSPIGQIQTNIQCVLKYNAHSFGLFISYGCILNPWTLVIYSYIVCVLKVLLCPFSCGCILNPWILVIYLSIVRVPSLAQMHTITVTSRERHGVSNHRQSASLFNRLLGTGGFPSQRASTCERWSEIADVDKKHLRDRGPSLCLSSASYRQIWKLEIGCWNYRITLKVGRGSGSSSVKF